MRVLVDESLPRQLSREIIGHSVITVRQQGLNSFKNGELLKRARAEGFDVLVTADQNMQYQQNLADTEVGIIVLVAKTNRIQDLIPLIPSLLSALQSIRHGQVVRVTLED